MLLELPPTRAKNLDSNTSKTVSEWAVSFSTNAGGELGAIPWKYRPRDSLFGYLNPLMRFSIGL